MVFLRPVVVRDAAHAASLPQFDPRRRSLLASALGLAGGATLLSLAGCGGASTDAATLRFTNATVDYASVDFYLAGSKVVSSLANAGATTTWGDVDAGDVQVSLHSAGSSTARLTETHAFTASSSTSVLAYGALSQSVKLRYFDESNAAADAGSTKLRIFHAAPSLEALDLYVTNTDSLSGLAPTITVSDYETLSAFVTLASDAYRLRITASGNQSSVLFDSSTKATLAGKAVVTLLVVPRTSGSLPNLVLLPEKADPTVLGNGLA
jgi:hypothetical protein